MTNQELATLATEVAARHETTITRTNDAFNYRPVVRLAVERDYRGAVTGTRVHVSVPVNAVLKRKEAFAMLNAFQKDLAVAAGVKITGKTAKTKGGGRTLIHTSGYWHMGHYNVDGFWCSLVVAT